MNDPLSSWNEGAAKTAILDYVARVTAKDGPDYVPGPERIATFDNDGTLWCERPVQAQIFFAMDRLKKLAKMDPGMRDRQPFKAFLEHDLATIASLGKQGALEFAMRTHSGMTEEEFSQIAEEWLGSTNHPTLKRLFKHCTFGPQIELLSYLRANGFKTFIVSGGGIDFMRACAEEIYGIPPEQVIGSSVKTRLASRGGANYLVKLAELNTFDDRDVKVQNIALHIGRRPILAFGNSDGDLPMLHYVRAGRHRSLALLLHHDDALREFAYDREFKLSPLVEGLDHPEGLVPVSMKNDWKAVFQN